MDSDLRPPYLTPSFTVGRRFSAARLGPSRHTDQTAQQNPPAPIPRPPPADLPDLLHAYAPHGVAPLCGIRDWQQLVPDTEVTCPYCVQMLGPSQPAPPLLPPPST